MYPRCIPPSCFPLSYVCVPLLCFGPRIIVYFFHFFLSPPLPPLVCCSLVVWPMQHRFAICALSDGVAVVRPLTSDVRSVLESIERLQVKTRKPLQQLCRGSDSVFFIYVCIFIGGDGCKWEYVVICPRGSLSLFQQLRERVEREPPGPHAWRQNWWVLGFLFELMLPPAARLSGMGFGFRKGQLPKKGIASLISCQKRGAF